MKILVANLGSTSFKYRLFELPHTGSSMTAGLREATSLETELARGGVERIGEAKSRVYASCQAGATALEALMPVPDHAVALQAALTQLTGEGGPLQDLLDQIDTRAAVEIAKQEVARAA